MKLLIGTKNSGKIEGARKAFTTYYSDIHIEGISVESEVPEQPVNEQTYLGSKNRIKNLKQYALDHNIQADAYLAIESGLTNQLGHWCIANIAIIEDSQGYESIGVSPCFPVPENKVEMIKKEGFSSSMDQIFGKEEERHNGKGGIDLLTKGKISRIDLTELAFTMALTKRINGDLWK